MFKCACNTVGSNCGNCLRSFRYQDQDGSHLINNREIMKEYFPYWSSKMKEVGKEELITPENCIKDFISLTWAWEV